MFRKGGLALNTRLKTNIVWNKFALAALLFGYVVANAMSLVLVYRSAEIITRLGLVKRLMVGFSSIMIPVVYIIFLIMIAVLAKDKNFPKRMASKLLLLLIVLTGIFVIGSFFYFDFQDLIHFPNYTFSKFHIYLPSLQLYANFQILVFVVGTMSFWLSNFTNWNKVFSWESVNKIFNVIVIAILPIILFNLLSALPVQLKDEVMVLRSFILDNNKSIRVDFPELKRQTDFIKKMTPPNATIIHPTQSVEFPLIGNQPLIRYDLYPRKLVSAKFAKEYVRNNRDEKIYYILFIAKNPINNLMATYPPHEVESSEIYLKYQDGKEESKKNVKYTTEFADGLMNLDIGLIKLK